MSSWNFWATPSCLSSSARNSFAAFPNITKGELSKLRAHIVSARRLLRPARELKIGEYLHLGKGEERSGGRSKSALLVNALEAVIAALYLDAGLTTGTSPLFCSTFWNPSSSRYTSTAAEKLPVMDYKSALQEAVHASGRSQARYVMVKEEGPDHRKMFTIEAHVPASPSGEPAFVCRSQGSTKKAAEQAAARLAWERLQSVESPSPRKSSPAVLRCLRTLMSEVCSPGASPAKPRANTQPAPPSQPERTLRHAVAWPVRWSSHLRHHLRPASLSNSCPSPWRRPCW